MKRKLFIIGVLGLVWLALPPVAYADNCAFFTDCFNTSRAALAATVGIGLFAALLSLGFDLVPGLGTVKGLIEGITGRDLITGQELSAWERALGIVPFGGALIAGGFAAVRIARAADNLGDVGRVADDAVTATNAIGDISEGMRAKILYGERVPNTNSPGGMSNAIRGGHSPRILDHPDYAVEVLSRNADGTTTVKYVTQFPDRNLSRIKPSTLAPSSWSDEKILDVTRQVRSSDPVEVRLRDGARLHRQTIDGVMWEVITGKDGGVIASYPTGGTPSVPGRW